MIMNKKYMCIAAGLLILAGCSNEDAALEQQGVAAEGVKTFTSFTATLGDMADTRAYLADGPEAGLKSVFWNEWENMIVFSDEDAEWKEYSTEGSGAGATASFIGDEVSGNEFYALYPRWGWEKSGDNPMKLYFDLDNADNPSTENEFRFQPPMVAKSTDNNLSFMQTTGMIHVTVGGLYKLYEVTMRGNNGEKIGWRGYVDLSEENPVFRIEEGDPDGQNESKGRWFWLDEEWNGVPIDIYFVIPPTTFENGFSLNIRGLDEYGRNVEFTKSSSSQLVVGRGAIKRFSLVDVDAELKAVAASYQEIVESQLSAMEDQQTAQALLALYNALDGGRWSHIDWGWGRTDAPVEEWQCLHFENSKLVGIYLNDKGLKGDVPAEIANLANLRELSMEGNQITSLPEELWSLTNLTYLNVSRNKLSGPLPAAAKNLSQLNELVLSDNNYEGPIPDEWFTGFGNLRYLYLTDNKLVDNLTEAETQSDMWQKLEDWDVINQQDGYVVTVPGYVSKIEFCATDITLKVGESFALNPVILPESATNKDLVWEYDSNVLSVDEETGVITALESGYWTSVSLWDSVSRMRAECFVFTQDADDAEEDDDGDGV